MRQILKFTILGLLLMNPFAHSISLPGSVHVGGGREKELVLKRMMFDLSLYLESKEGRATFPEVVAYNLAHPDETISDLFENIALVFKEGRVVDGFNGDRDCVSHFEDPKKRYIECNNNAQLDPFDLNGQPALYAFLFHEILVQAGLEEPVSADIPSVYPISSRMKFHKEVYERMLPGEHPNPLSSPRKVRFVVSNWAKLGYVMPAILQIDLDQKNAEIVYDPFIGEDLYAMNASIESTPFNNCITLTNSSRGEQSLYCDDIVSRRSTQTFSRRSLTQSSVGESFTLPTLNAHASGRPYEKRGGIFKVEGTDLWVKVDTDIELLDFFPRCERTRTAFSQFFKFHPLESTDLAMNGLNFNKHDGFDYSMGKAILQACEYIDSDTIKCTQGQSLELKEKWVRVTDADLNQACDTSGTATLPDPSEWKNSVIAPDGTIWSDVIGLFQNCMGGRAGQTGHYLNTLCNLDSNDSFAGQVLSDGTILQSDAVEACEKIGGKLPTLKQIESLPAEPKYWPNFVSPYLKPIQFWTSTLNPNGLGPRSAYGDDNVPGGRSAYVFVAFGDDSATYEQDPQGIARQFRGTVASDNRNWLNYVRCVSR